MPALWKKVGSSPLLISKLLMLSVLKGVNQGHSLRVDK